MSLTLKMIFLSVSLLLTAYPISAAEWVDTGRTACARSEKTENNHNHGCQSSCERCSGGKEDKWCADRVYINFSIGDDPQQFHRFAPFEVKPSICKKFIKAVEGPKTHWKVEFCSMDPPLRTFRATVYGFTHPQVFEACLPIQERK